MTQNSHNARKVRSYRCSILIAAIFYLLTGTVSFSDPVYRSNDGKGVPFYSSKPQEKGAQPAKLPNIAKGQYGEAKPVKLTCVGHGGINCQAGADSDGSVICYDDFRNSIQRFAFSCGAAKLTVISESYKVSLGESSLVIRNNSAVAAKGVTVTGPDNLFLEGPKELEPYGSAQYSTKQVLDAASKIQVTCENCP